MFDACFHQGNIFLSSGGYTSGESFGGAQRAPSVHQSSRCHHVPTPQQPYGFNDSTQEEHGSLMYEIDNHLTSGILFCDETSYFGVQLGFIAV